MATGISVQREIERLGAELAREFRDVPTDVIARAVRAEFARRSSSPIQDFVPIFVQRSSRERLRATTSEARPPSPVRAAAHTAA